MGAAGVFTVLFNRGQGMGDYWEGTYQYMDWLQLFDVVLFYIIFLIATLLLLGGFELAATYTSFREELVDKRNLPSLVSSGLNKVGGCTACLDRDCVGLRKCCCLNMVGMSCCPVQREPGVAGCGGDASASIVALADRGQVAGGQRQSGRLPLLRPPPGGDRTCEWGAERLRV